MRVLQPRPWLSEMPSSALILKKNESEEEEEQNEDVERRVKEENEGKEEDEEDADEDEDEDYEDADDDDDCLEDPKRQRIWLPDEFRTEKPPLMKKLPEFRSKYRQLVRTRIRQSLHRHRH